MSDYHLESERKWIWLGEHLGIVLMVVGMIGFITVGITGGVIALRGIYNDHYEFMHQCIKVNREDRCEELWRWK